MGLLNQKKEAKKKEETFDDQLLEVDFFCQLAYMAAISTSGISRSELFFHSARLPYSATRFFRRVDFVAKMFNHDYTQACRIVGEKTKDPEIKAFLLRFSNALSSGEDVTAFLSRESAILAESYGNNYERRLDLVKKWADAYVALMLTPALVTVMGVVTTIIGVVSEAFLISMMVLAIATGASGSWFLYRTSPREVKNHSLPIRSKEQILSRNLAKILFPIGGILVIFLLLMNVGIGVAMIAAGIFLLPVGIIAVMDDRKITKRDSDIGSLLRGVGGTMQAIGATAAEAISRIDFRSLGILRQDVELLHKRLLAGIGAYACWRSFVQETGSELINRSVTTFWDGITMGGEPQEVGNEASAFALKVSLLRAQRNQISAGFTWLAIAMHSVLTGLIVFIFTVFSMFFELIETMFPARETIESGAAATLPTFGLFGMDPTIFIFLNFMVIVIACVLILANSFAIYAVNGGYPMKIAFYLGITALISGAVFTIVPWTVNRLLSTLF